MPTEETLETTTNDATAHSGSQDTSTDWEARFKGLQKSYAGLQSQLTKRQNQLDELQAKYDTALTDYEGQIAELKSNLGKVSDDFAKASKQLGEYEVKLTERERRDKIRTELANSEAHRNLLPFFENGFLDSAVGLEGEELTSYLDKFNSMMGAKAAEAFEEKIEGSTPSNSPSPGSSPAGQQKHPAESMSRDELMGWLNANALSPEYDTYEQFLFKK